MNSDTIDIDIDSKEEKKKKATNKKATNKKATKPVLELIIVEDEPLANKLFEPNTIYNEDCIIGLKRFGDETVDIIICDPPL